MKASQLNAALQTLSANGHSLGTAELLLYQSYANLLDLKPSQQISAQMSGGYLSKIKGRGMEFDEARHYQPGDDIRAIDWRVTARTGKTHTKIYREERERPVFILCDFRASMRFGTQFVMKSVQAAHLASLIAWSATQRGDKVGAIIFDNESHVEIKPMSRKRAVLSLTHSLVSMHKRAQQSTQPEQMSSALERACMGLRRVAKPGSLVYLISDFAYMNNAALLHLGQLKRHCDVQAVQIFDPLEHALPRNSISGNVTLTDGHEKQVISLGDTATKSQYAHQRALANDNIKEALRPCVVRLQHISAGLPLVEQMLMQETIAT